LGTDDRNFIANKTHFHSNQNVISIWTPGAKTTTTIRLKMLEIILVERLFVFFFILTAHFEAIGFLYINPSSVLEFERQELKTNRIRTYRFYC
jgi:hypothetical protein